VLGEAKVVVLVRVMMTSMLASPRRDRWPGGFDGKRWESEIEDLVGQLKQVFNVADTQLHAQSTRLAATMFCEWYFFDVRVKEVE
jgi:hypothetical protein